jgi:diguanylate cyclase (GGDEF)-like protein/PAS domain S-box-containing protein
MASVRDRQIQHIAGDRSRASMCSAALGLLSGAWLLCGGAIPLAQADTQGTPLRISAASTVTDTGLIQALADHFHAQHPDITLVVRTGGALAALEDGRRGRADLVITHHRPSEELFVEQGYGIERVQFMYDEFAIFGPPADPLKLASDADLFKVLKRLALARVPFLAPAPQSGTYLKLVQLWEAVGITPDWPGYETTNASAAATLQQAALFESYTLANMGTYLANRALLAGHIVPLYRDHPLLRNTYSAIVVNPERVADAQAEKAQQFLDYLISDAGQDLIARFGETTFDTRLFTPTAALDPGLKAARLAREVERKNLWLQLLAALLLILAALLATLAVFTRRYRRAEAAQRASEERFVLAVSGTSDAIWDWNMETGEVYFSPRWKELLGYVGYDDEIENTIDEWKDRIHPDDRELVLAILDSYIEGRSPHFSSQHRLRTKRGHYIWVLERGKVLWDKHGKPLRLTGSTTDISQRTLQAEQSERQALYDLLTELPNRSLFLDRVEHALHAAKRHASTAVVMVISLNHFQEINAMHGHETADRVLREVTRYLNDSLRDSDTAARLGSDEFGVLLPDTDMPHAILPLHRILQALDRRSTLDGHSVQLSASIGVALYPDHGEQAELLLQRAHVAMFNARRMHVDHSIYEPPAPQVTGQSA